jgi:hypothetical protein
MRTVGVLVAIHVSFDGGHHSQCAPQSSVYQSTHEVEPPTFAPPLLPPESKWHTPASKEAERSGIETAGSRAAGSGAA